MRRIILAAIGLALLGCSPAFAQSTTVVTVRIPTIITTGNTFQLLNGAVTQPLNRKSLTIQNNNAADNCFVLIGGPWVAGDTTASTRTENSISFTGAKASILLLPGGSYTRYYPYIPADQILVTCASASDSMYADVQ